MNIITKNLEYKLEIKKSVFITKMYKIEDLSQVESIMEALKKEYKDATHYCYAYRFNGQEKVSDDNEPGGTAGRPILDVLEKNDIDYCLCVVIRYFGGIKLGAGGLLRAYSKAVRECLDKDFIKEISDGYLIKIKTNYENQKNIDYILKNNKYEKEFDIDIIYKVEIKEEDLKKLDSKNIKYEIIKKIKI